MKSPSRASKPTWRTAFAAWKAWSKSSGPDLTLLQLMAINARLRRLGLCVTDHERAIGFVLGYMNAKKRGRSKK